MRKNSKFLLALAGFSLSTINAAVETSVSVQQVDPELVSTYSAGSTLSKAVDGKAAEKAKVELSAIEKFVLKSKPSVVLLLLRDLLGASAFYTEKLDNSLYDSVEKLASKAFENAFAEYAGLLGTLRFDSKTPADVKQGIELKCKEAVEEAYNKALDIVKNSSEYTSLLSKIQVWNSLPVFCNYSIFIDKNTGAPKILVKYYVQDKHIVDLEFDFSKKLLDSLIKTNVEDSFINEISPDEVMFFFPALRSEKMIADLFKSHEHMLVDKLHFKVSKAKLEAALNEIGIEFKFDRFRVANDLEHGIMYSKKFAELLQNPRVVDAVLKSSSYAYVSRLLGSYVTDQTHSVGHKSSLPLVVNKKIKGCVYDEGFSCKLKSQISRVSALPVDNGVVASGRIEFSGNELRDCAKNLGGFNVKIKKIFDIDSTMFFENLKLVELKDAEKLARTVYENAKKEKSANISSLKADKDQVKGRVQAQEKILKDLEKERKNLVSNLSKSEKSILEFFEKNIHIHPVTHLKLSSRYGAAETKRENHKIATKVEKKNPNASAEELKQAFEANKVSADAQINQVRGKSVMPTVVVCRDGDTVSINHDGGIQVNTAPQAKTEKTSCGCC